MMRNPVPALFVARLAELVGESEEAVTGLARSLGVHRSAVYRWLGGESAPEGSKLAAIADHFGVTMDWLWGRPGYARERNDRATWDGRERRREHQATPG